MNRITRRAALGMIAAGAAAAGYGLWDRCADGDAYELPAPGEVVRLTGTRTYAVKEDAVSSFVDGLIHAYDSSRGAPGRAAEERFYGTLLEQLPDPALRGQLVQIADEQTARAGAVTAGSLLVPVRQYLEQNGLYLFRSPEGNRILLQRIEAREEAAAAIWGHGVAFPLYTLRSRHPPPAGVLGFTDEFDGSVALCADELEGAWQYLRVFRGQQPAGGSPMDRFLAETFRKATGRYFSDPDGRGRFLADIRLTGILHEAGHVLSREFRDREADALLPALSELRYGPNALFAFHTLFRREPPGSERDRAGRSIIGYLTGFIDARGEAFPELDRSNRVVLQNGAAFLPGARALTEGNLRYLAREQAREMFPSIVCE